MHFHFRDRQPDRQNFDTLAKQGYRKKPKNVISARVFIIADGIDMADQKLAAGEAMFTAFHLADAVDRSGRRRASQDFLVYRRAFRDYHEIVDGDWVCYKTTFGEVPGCSFFSLG